MIDRPLRSALYLPADRPSAIEKARQSDADAVILDLEDAVAPDAKADARTAAVAAAGEGGFGNRLLVIRANGLDTAWGADDLEALAGAPVDAVLLPKVASPTLIAQARAALGGAMPVWAMIETCEAFLDLGAIAASEGLEAFVIGTNDLALEMRCTLDVDRGPVLSLLTQAVVAARAHGLAAIDGVFNDIADEDGLARQCAQGSAIGFDGKTVIHPKQLAIANAAFGPTETALTRSRAVVDAFALPENAGKGVIKVDGKMTELLHLKEAQRILAMQAAIERR